MWTKTKRLILKIFRLAFKKWMWKFPRTTYLKCSNQQGKAISVLNNSDSLFLINDFFIFEFNFYLFVKYFLLKSRVKINEKIINSVIGRVVESLNVLKRDPFSDRKGWICSLERVSRAWIRYWSQWFFLNRWKIVSFWHWSLLLPWSNWNRIESTFNSAHFISAVIKLNGDIFLNPIDPFPFINPTIIPLHLSITVSVIILESTNVLGSILPMVNTLSIFLIIHVLTFIKIAM